MAGTMVVLLRGVNVNGITVKSAPLRACIESIDGVQAAKTVLASGNVVVRTTLSASGLKTDAEAALRRDFGYDAWVVVVNQGDLGDLIERTPWADDDPSRHVYLTFSSDRHGLDAVEGEAPASDVARIDPHVLAWLCPKGESTTAPIAKLMAKAKFKSSTTTRNLRTVLKLRDLELPAS